MSTAGQPSLTSPTDAVPNLPRNRRDALQIAGVLLLAVLVPFVATDYWLKAILIPTLIFSISALGLNILSGTAGLISLGQAAFMAVGAFTGVILYGRYGVPLPLSIAAAGTVAAATGVLVGIPSLRIRGLYLLVATLAAQFMILWIIQRAPWIASGGAHSAVNTPPVSFAGWSADTPARQYYLALALTVALTVFAVKVLRGRVGRGLVAMRDHETAAEVLGVPIARYKLLAFALSSFYGGVAGALVVFCWTGAATVQDYELNVSIHLLGMVIVGGLGSVTGAFMGTAFIMLLPILLNVTTSSIASVFGHTVLKPGLLANLELIVFGVLLLWFLIKEPQGLAALWNRFTTRAHRSRT